jgi:hypothetical protein
MKIGDIKTLVSRKKTNNTMISRTVRGNLPLLLNQPSLIWTVQSGAIALFAVKTINGTPEGERRYLFDVMAGEALFSITLNGQENDLENDLGILAVAIEPTDLQEEAIAETDLPRLLPLLERWIYQLAQVKGLPKNIFAKPVYPDRYVSLVKDQIFQPPKGQVLWVQCQQGTAQWLGYDSLTLTPESGIFPLAAGLWVQASENFQISVQSTAEIDSDSLFAGLNRFHTWFLQSIKIMALLNGNMIY